VIEKRVNLRPAVAAALFVVAAVTQGCGAAEGFPWVLSADRPEKRADRPAIAKLDPDLRAAISEAARDARKDGVRMRVTSGWRSRAHQERLLDEAVARYGSLEEALRYVATPDASAHVTGDAVDIGPTDADVWLGRYGAEYGLCQVFANEIWHFELATTPGGDCPEMLPDGSSRR
jgi:hypothetical protein